MSKGSTRRPRQITREEEERRWAQTFGRKGNGSTWPFVEFGPDITFDYEVAYSARELAEPPGDLDHIVDEMQRENLRP